MNCRRTFAWASVCAPRSLSWAAVPVRRADQAHRRVRALVPLP
jgi:hypothetical protein